MSNRMDGDARFRVDPVKVVHETVEDEVILIHMDSGNYYSLLGAGAHIWHLAAGSHSVDEITDALGAAYGEERRVVEPVVREIVGALAEERLLTPGGQAANGAAAGLVVDGAFAPPRLEKYEDMQEYLLVDPIHEVDPSGWPNAAP